MTDFATDPAAPLAPMSVPELAAGLSCPITLGQLNWLFQQALGGFIQAGTGAVARTVQARLRDTISVTDFGAVGDDATDNLAAFTAALAALPDGGALFVPQGTYRLSAAVAVPNSKSLTIYGVGDGSKLRRISGAGPIFDCGSGSLSGTRLIVRGLFFQGPVAGTSNGIRLLNCNTARIESCVFQNQVTGIDGAFSYAVEILGNTFDVCSNYGVIFTTSAHNAVLERNNFYTCGSQAVRFDAGSDNIVVDNNDFENNNVALRIRDCTAVSFQNNYVEYGGGELLEFLGTNRQVTIERNWLALGSGSAATLDLANINGGSFTGNTIYNLSVTIAGTAVDVEIGQNYKFGTGTMAVQNWAALTLLNGWTQQASYAPASYRKDAFNNVVLRGNLLTGTAGTVVCTLPVGYRPGSYATFATCGTGGPQWVEVRPNGDVYAVTAPAAQGSLNGISFKAEA